MKSVHQQGWTLLQLMLALAVLGVLVALALPSHKSEIDKVKLNKAIKDVTMISLALDDMRNDQGRLPDSLDQIGMGGMLDPWGHPYRYTNIQDAQGKGSLRKDRNLVPINTDYDLYSMGPDGKSAGPLTAKSSQDDIIRAANGSYIGLASDY